MAFILEYRGVFRTRPIQTIIAKPKNPGVASGPVRGGSVGVRPRLSGGVLRAFAACAYALCVVTPAGATGDILDGVLAERGSAGWGLVVRVEQSQYRGGGVRFDLLPVYLYDGEHVYLHANRAGLKLALGPESRVDAFVSRRLENSPVENVPDSLSGITARVPENDIGMSFAQRFGWGSAYTEVLHDVSGVSGGTEWRLGVESERRRGALRLQPYLVLAQRSARLNGYYYGVSAAEATPTRPGYQPGAGVNTSVGLNARYDLGDRWHFLAGVSATVWSGTVRHSPIAEDRVQLAGFGGLAYEFTSTPRKDPESHPPLTFKVLYGRSSPCNLLPIMELRCRSTKTDDRTSLESFEIGWPFIESPHGWPVMIAWYAGLLRHEERRFQPEFWQVNGYLKAFYWGFPWSERVRTRIGFGGGFSYAQRVPYVEARDQDARGRNTSKFLQYLDPTIDVSVGDIIGDRSLRETYFGFGVSHRSGIFGMGQIFDNVNGGSNYIYTYLERRM
jgi:outer membrane protein